ncbi:hypothetical protein [Stackebrandtia soli]|uniref:hypothetical protein n=1 Tax=Stackebrandtia soli TaxID=1892856 RepID=UPI0039EB6139
MRNTKDTVRQFGSIVVASIAAIWWSIGLTVLQPMYEPRNVDATAWIGNSTYWMRESRWAMVAVIVLAAIWAHRGNPLRSIMATIGGLAWLAADTLLNRADVSGFAATSIAIVVSLTVVAIGVGSGVRDPAVPPGRRVLIASFCVASALAGTAAILESPTNVEPALLWGGFISGALSTVLALGCAVEARRNPIPWKAVITAATICVVLVAAARILLPFAMLVMLLVPCILITMGYLLVTTGPMRFLHAPAIAACCPALLMLGTIVFTVRNDGAKLVTAWAGNPPVNSVDVDFIFTALAVFTGLIIGTVATAFAREPRPKT